MWALNTSKWVFDWGSGAPPRTPLPLPPGGGAYTALQEALDEFAVKGRRMKKGRELNEYQKGRKESKILWHVLTILLFLITL